MEALKERLLQALPHSAHALQKACDLLPSTTKPVAQHIFDAGGKRLRPFLTVLTARLFGYNKADIYDLAVTMEMLHAATLLHDDVFDGADTRRGAPVAHKIFGITNTILAGDAILAAANMHVAEYNDAQLCRCFSEATMQTASGEILEIQYLRCLDQEAHIYNDIVRGKTAWLLMASCLMGAMRAGVKDEALRLIATYGEELGMAFQMVDDALDFAPQEITGKPSGGDLCEGKLTPPIALYRAYLQGDERTTFDAAFSSGTFTQEDATRIGADICRLGFDTQPRAKAGDARKRATDALELLTPYIKSDSEKKLLAKMAHYVQQRQK